MMVSMTRRTAASRALLAFIVVAGCAGPEPSGSADGAVDTSPSPDALLTPSSEATQSPMLTLAPSASATAEPTQGPKPTPEGAYSLRTDVQINEDVVDRRGVPADLRDRYWWTPNGDAGLLGTTAQIGLPSDEHIATIEEGIVVATRQLGRDRWGETELVVRDFESGVVIRKVSTPLRNVGVVLVGSRLFWTGELAGDQEAPVDGGVWATDVRKSTDPIEIVRGGRAFPGVLCGRGLSSSPSGRTLAARALCNGSSLWTDLIDTDTQTRINRLQGEWVIALTDDTYVLTDFEPSDGVTWGHGGMSAHDLRTGERLWRFPGEATVDRYVSSQWGALGSNFVTEYYWNASDGTEVVLAVIDSRSGEARTLLVQPDDFNASLRASFESSASGHLVMADGWDLREQIRLRGTSISVVRIGDGTLIRDAFEIDPPWLCGDNLCREDT
jgi:hypothetical protein